MLLVDDWLMDFSNFFFMNNRLMMFMDDILMMFMDNILMMLMKNILMVLMDNILVMLFYNWLVNVGLNLWCHCVFLNQSLTLVSLNNRSLIMADNSGFLFKALFNNGL